MRRKKLAAQFFVLIRAVLPQNCAFSEATFHCLRKAFGDAGKFCHDSGVVADMKAIEKVLIYKRTHRGDPDGRGIFGIHDCMRSVRDFDYEAVIGVGGIGAEPRAQGIAGKITWIGLGPHKARASGRTLVTFDHFLLDDIAGSSFRAEAPNLAARIYRDNIRILIHDLTPKQSEEVYAILNRAYSAPPSPSRTKFRVAIPTAMEGTGCSCHGRCYRTTAAAPTSRRAVQSHANCSEQKGC